MNARREYRPRQTTLLTALKEVFYKTYSSKFIRFTNGNGLSSTISKIYVQTLVKQKVTLPILSVSLGICPRPFKTRLRIRCFHYCHYSEKPGFNISGNSQTIRPSRPSQTVSFVGTFPLPSSGETDWSQACTVKVKFRFTDTSLLRAVFFNVRNSYFPSKFNDQLNKGTVLLRTLFWGP